MEAVGTEGCGDCPYKAIAWKRTATYINAEDRRGTAERKIILPTVKTGFIICFIG
ncbi:MAG: hypothetical protein ACLRSW_05050 [Christensenellaceae bacterium]